MDPIHGRLTGHYCIHIHVIISNISACIRIRVRVHTRAEARADLVCGLSVRVHMYKESLIICRGEGSGTQFPDKFHSITDILYHSKHRDYLQ